MQTLSSTERIVFMDWLRVIAIGVLLCFHTGMLFVGWGWHIMDAETVPALELPMDIAHRLRMPLLFIIAGASVYFALGRRSAFEVLRERGKRLLLPLVAGMLLVTPPQMYFEQVFRQRWEGSYVAFYADKILHLSNYPGGPTNFYHLWFIAYLVVYCVLLIPVFAGWRRRGLPAWKPGFWLYWLALPLGINEVLLRPHFPESHNLFSDWWTFNHYALLFSYGFVLCGIQGMWEWMMRWRRVNLAVALVVTITLLVAQALGGPFFQDDTPWDAISANVFTWAWLLVFLGYGKRWLSFSNATLRYLGEAGYPIYILHQTVIITVGYFVIQQPWAWQTKYLVVLSATIVLSFAVYEGFIRRWRLPRLLFGMKAKSTGPHPPESSASSTYPSRS